MNRPVQVVKPRKRVSIKITTLPKIPEKTTKNENISPKNTENTQIIEDNSKIELPLFWAMLTYISSLVILPVFGIIQDQLRKFQKTPREGEYFPSEDTKDFTSLYQSFEAFFTRNMYSRGRDCWNKPICGVPGGKVDLMTRIPINETFKLKYKFPGTVEKNKLNLASYNYLGFAEQEGICADAAVKATKELGIGVCSTERETARLPIHDELEQLTADFLGVEDAMVFGMGFATNSMNIPCLVDEKSCIISDQLNHASIVTGCKLSGATVKTFKHNNMKSLESVLRKSILDGNPKRNFRPFNKILVIVEGIYSMEGTICNLKEIMKLKKKYKFCVYLDEAHSIGALGKTGRGCCEYNGVDSKEVDIMMGTFTKSFGAAGGYIGGKKEVVEHLRRNNHGSTYAASMSPPVAAQAKAALHMVGYTEEGKSRITQLAENARFFRSELVKRNFYVFGDGDSPVVPVLTCELAKMLEFQRILIKHGLAIVVVAFPATKLTEGRARFCLSAAHSKNDLIFALDKIQLVGEELGLTFYTQ